MSSPTDGMQKMVSQIASDLDGLTARLMGEGRYDDARLVVAATETIEALFGALEKSWGSLSRATEKVGSLQGRVRSVSERLDALSERMDRAADDYGVRE